MPLGDNKRKFYWLIRYTLTIRHHCFSVKRVLEINQEITLNSPLPFLNSKRDRRLSQYDLVFYLVTSRGCSCYFV